MGAHLNGIGEVRSKFEFGPDTVGKWVHVAVTYDSKARNIQLFVNGQPEASSSVGTPRPVDLRRVKIGSWEGHMRMWKGAIDEVFLYDRALSEAEITKLFAGEKVQ